MKIFSYFKRKKNLLILFLAALIILFPYFKNFNFFKEHPQIDSSKMYVHYIDVGQGDSILIQINNKNLLIDSGPKSNKRDILNYLNSFSINRLDYIIATHPHEDHIGNMADIIHNYSIDHFYAPKITSDSKSFEDMIYALKNKNLKINIIKKGTDSIDLGENCKISVFSPISNSYDNLNNYSPIIKIQYLNTSFLFTGDAEKEVEEQVMSEDVDLSSDVLKIGHHGSSTSSSINFLNKVNPSIAIISAGKNNIYNHPDYSTIMNLKTLNIKTYETDKNGTIVLVSDGKTINRIRFDNLP